MHLTLAVPGLLALDPATLAAARSLARLARYAGPPATRRGDLDALLAAGSLDSATGGSAPLAALGAGLDPGTSHVLRADPVSLVAGRNDVALAARIDDLDGDETGAMIATLNAHFAHDGLTFHAPRADAWFVLQDTAPDLTTTPLAVVRGAIYPWLPAGGDAVRWRRWLSEMQMLLHAHPANAAREARGRVPVTGVWISEGGRLAERTAGTGSIDLRAAGRGRRHRTRNGPAAPNGRGRAAESVSPSCRCRTTRWWCSIVPLQRMHRDGLRTGWDRPSWRSSAARSRRCRFLPTVTGPPPRGTPRVRHGASARWREWRQRRL